MPRAILDLQNPTDLAAVGGQWRYAIGLVPGKPNEGLVAPLEGSPGRPPALPTWGAGSGAPVTGSITVPVKVNLPRTWPLRAVSMITKDKTGFIIALYSLPNIQQSEKGTQARFPALS